MASRKSPTLGASRPMLISAFRSSNSLERGRGFVETAEKIAGENPSLALVLYLQRWSASVFIDGNVHAIQPGRAEVRSRLQNLRDAAEFVRRSICDPAVFTILIGDEFGPMPDNSSIDAILKEIGRRADIASSRPSLLDTGMDERLLDLRDAAKLVADEVRDSTLREFLQNHQTIGPPAPMAELGAALTEISRQALAALLSPHLANEAGQTKAGSGRALPPMGSSPRAFCAAVILEAWAHFHDGEYPRASNHPTLWEAAEEYWRACGGTKRWPYGQLLAWRPYFKEVSDDSLTEIRREIRRHLKLSFEHTD